jgi:hypothetical protein
MRVPNAGHLAGAWRIREIVPDFILEDVWALPVHGGAEDFEVLLELLASFDPAGADSLAARFLWDLRDFLGRRFGIGRISSIADGGGHGDGGTLPIPGTRETSLIERLPRDLLETKANLDFGGLPFVPLYRTDFEFAAEVSNRTVHGVLHLAWVKRGGGRYQGQMAVYVRPRGLLGRGYLALIRPFRYLVVYPAAIRQIERSWNARVAAQA